MLSYVYIVEERKTKLVNICLYQMGISALEKSNCKWPKQLSMIRWHMARNTGQDFIYREFIYNTESYCSKIIFFDLIISSITFSGVLCFYISPSHSPGLPWLFFICVFIIHFPHSGHYYLLTRGMIKPVKKVSALPSCFLPLISWEYNSTYRSGLLWFPSKSSK